METHHPYLLHARSCVGASQDAGHTVNAESAHLVWQLDAAGCREARPVPTNRTEFTDPS